LRPDLTVLAIYGINTIRVKATLILRQKQVLKAGDSSRLGIFEFVIWQVPRSRDYPQGVKYRAWLSESGRTVFGFDNHKPKGPHLHIGEVEVGYVYRGLDALKEDIIAMIRQEGFIYEE
jgi:hypothetical protein